MMLVFDLDDTLFKEADFVKSALTAVAHTVDDAALISFHRANEILLSAPSTYDGFNNLLDEIHKFHPDCTLELTELLDTYRFHKPDIHLSDEVEKTLKQISHRGIGIGIITDGRGRTQRNKIEALDLQKFVDNCNIIISEEVGADKSSSKPFEMIMAMNPDESSFIYVGDNPAKDFLWPRKLGWTTVQADDTAGVNIHPQNTSLSNGYMPAFHISRFSEILKFID